ncbi:MAG: chordopoxvirus fusion protein [Desulfosoma sp.]|uniref:chordopoxvirus fusion protein n=1 Tax=Desulfosoma sp. TaxID=2603217 RepID=UPI004048FCD3
MGQTTHQGLTSELYKTIIAIVDERVREIRVTREDFDDLKQVVRELAEAQKRTEARVEELAEAQKRTELRLEELAEAQKKTELKLAVLTKEHQKTREMVDRLAHTVGYRLEDEAIWALPPLLARDFGMAMETALERTWLAAGPHRYVEVNIRGSGVVEGRRVHIVGEAKSHLMKGDVDKFLVTVAKVHQITGMEVFPVLVTYQTSPIVKRDVAEKGIKLYMSYELRVLPSFPR